MYSDELETPTSERSATWYEIACRKIRKRWVQVALVLVVGALAIAVSGLLLAPKKAKTVKDPQYLYCPKCDAESRYEAKLDGEPCPKCPDDPVGTLVGRATSIKESGKKSPWKWVYLATSLEALATIAAVVMLMYRPSSDPSNTFYVFSCPHCGQRLRFRHVSLGGLGQCSRCKRPVRFPIEDDAVLEEDLIREEEARRAAEEEEDED